MNNFNEPDKDLVRQIQGLSNSAPLDYLEETFDLMKQNGLKFPQGQVQTYRRDRNGDPLKERIIIDWAKMQEHYDQGNPFDYTITRSKDSKGDPVVIVHAPDKVKAADAVEKSNVRYAKGGLVSKPLYDRA
jgi:hypothetical protein